MHLFVEILYLCSLKILLSHEYRRETREIHYRGVVDIVRARGACFTGTVAENKKRISRPFNVGGISLPPCIEKKSLTNCARDWRIFERKRTVDSFF